VSPDAVKMRSHPLGGVQDACTKSVFVGKRVSVTLMVGVSVTDAVAVSLRIDASVNVAVGNSNEMVGGMGVGVA
jgi:hypothetical protein